MRWTLSNTISSPTALRPPSTPRFLEVRSSFACAAACGLDRPKSDFESTVHNLNANCVDAAEPQPLVQSTRALSAETLQPLLAKITPFRAVVGGMFCRSIHSNAVLSAVSQPSRLVQGFADDVLDLLMVVGDDANSNNTLSSTSQPFRRAGHSVCSEKW